MQAGICASVRADRPVVQSITKSRRGLLPRRHCVWLRTLCVATHRRRITDAAGGRNSLQRHAVVTAARAARMASGLRLA